MELPLNTTPPLTMHIDLNSAFASIEQQANRLLRGKPIGVVANAHTTGTIIAPSIEAKRFGVQTGDRVFMAKEIVPQIQIIQSDPDKYFHVHKLFSNIFHDYTPDVTALSIDEAVLHFDGIPGINLEKLITIAYEIKKRIKLEIGEWLTCNIGISTNRFLAKLAASLNKPDGLDVITHKNLRLVYMSRQLTDLCGINVRYKQRLNLVKIYTPLEFLDAPMLKLKHDVFKSIVGFYWYARLRGHEVDKVIRPRRSYGQGYHLHHFTADLQDLSKLMMKLCEKMGRRVRRAGYVARGVAVYTSLKNGYWHMSHKFGQYMYASTEFYNAAMQVLSKNPLQSEVTQLSVSSYDLIPKDQLPIPLFEDDKTKLWQLADAMDTVNNWFGEYVIYPAKMHGLDNEIVKRVPFHATADTLSEIYEEGHGITYVA